MGATADEQWDCAISLADVCPPGFTQQAHAVAVSVGVHTAWADVRNEAGMVYNDDALEDGQGCLCTYRASAGLGERH